MARVARVFGAKFHPSAQCLNQDCPWGAPASPLARAEAKDHASETGHLVEVLTETVDRYRREA